MENCRKIEFEATEANKPPLFMFEGKKVAVAAATYSYRTATDESLGSLIIVVDGYLPGETKQRRFVCDILADTIEEVEEDLISGRFFAVLNGTEWIRTQYEDLKENDVIRIFDNGVLYVDLEGANTWMVVGKDENGRIQVVEATPKECATIG